MSATFTHKGTLYGDARAGDRKPTVKLRLTPSGGHWVDQYGRKYRARSGSGMGNFPMWRLDINSIEELP
jgi:hypothetical protein